jgi:hypothetical protein
VSVDGLFIQPSPTDIYPSVLLQTISDTLSVRNVHAHDTDYTHLYFRGPVCNVSNVHLSNLTRPCLSIKGTDTRVDSIFVDSCHFGGGKEVFIRGDSSFVASSIRIDQCTSSNSNISSNCLLSLICRGSKGGVLRDFTITNNTIGDLEIPDDHSQPNTLRCDGVSLLDGLLANNEMHVWLGLNGYGSFISVRGALVKAQFALPRDTMRVRNCIFRDNLLVDHDDYSEAIDFLSPSRGRSLYIEVPAYHDLRYIEIDHLEFINNRQPNHCPELGAMTEYVGSDLWIEIDGFDTEWVSLHDIKMEGIDDGGIDFYTQGQRSEVYNLWLKDVNRKGASLRFRDRCNDPTVENIYIENVTEQDLNSPYPHTYSMQLAFSSTFEVDAIVRNVSIVGCDQRRLIVVGHEMQNSILFDNDFEVLNSHPNPPVYSNMWTDFDLPGADNVVGNTLASTQNSAPPFSPVIRPVSMQATRARFIMTKKISITQAGPNGLHKVVFAMT